MYPLIQNCLAHRLLYIIYTCSGLEEPPHCLPTELHSLLQRMLKALSHLSSSVSTSSTQFMASIVCGFDYSPFKVMLEELWSKGVHTLFVARGVLEITGILRRAVHNMTLAITQVRFVGMCVYVCVPCSHDR